MSSLVKKRIIEIVDSYPIGERFTINTVHSDLFQRHGRNHLPSRAALAEIISQLSNVRTIDGIPRSGYVKQ